ncbi:MAG: membrane lipoprotein lipid attachment site-containing protein [Erysipelotrichales bacterium]|nr:membrane lipoprotein lipid attachment site-containing protein [Erysipelotrichales bacterium]
MKKIIFLLLMVVVLTGCSSNADDCEIRTHEEILEAYPNLRDPNHILVQISYSDLMNNVLTSNNDILIFFAFFECPFCQGAIGYVNRLAKEAGFERIYYFDIRAIRTEAGERYRALIEKLAFTSEEMTGVNNDIPMMRVPTILRRNNGETVGWVTQGAIWNDNLDALDPEFSELLTTLYWELFTR